MSCRIKVTIARLQDLRKFKTKGVTYVTSVFLLRRGIFKMNLIFDFLIGRPQPNNLLWMFSAICTTSCIFGKSGIDFFAIGMLVVVAELGACNWISAWYKICIVSSAKKKTHYEINKKNKFKAHKLKVRQIIISMAVVMEESLFPSDVTCAIFPAHTSRQDFFNGHHSCLLVSRAASVHSLWKICEPRRSPWS